MKLNETLLIVGAVLASLVLFKGRAASSNVKTFSGKYAVPVLPIENKTPSFQIPQIETFLQKIQIPQIETFLQKIKIPDLEIFKQFFPVTDTNIQLKEILNIEEEKKNQRVSNIQNELDQTNSYIRSEQKIAQVDQNNIDIPYSKYNQKQYYLYDSDRERISKFTGKKLDDYTGTDVINYYEDLVGSESALGFAGIAGGLNYRQFPQVTAALTNYYNREISKRNIGKGYGFANKQEEEINQIQEEYQTRFGGLSRYG